MSWFCCPNCGLGTTTASSTKSSASSAGPVPPAIAGLKPSAIINVEEEEASSASKIQTKVRAEEIQRLKDRTSNTPGASSAYGIGPKPALLIELRNVELWPMFKGEAPMKLTPVPKSGT